MKRPKVLILHVPGTNCDRESELAVKMVGGRPETVAVRDLLARKRKLDAFDFLFLPGGFSYGDDIAAGRLLALEFSRLPGLKAFVRSGRPVLGVCNGFQVLVKSGLLPGDASGQSASFTANDSGKFEARWVRLRVDPASPCVFTRGLPETIELPVAHGEGKFVAGSAKVLDALDARAGAPLRYLDNPNGSLRDIAGVCNPAGNVFGLMPHPERYLTPYHHPSWSRRLPGGRELGLRMIENGVRSAVCAG